MIQFFLYDTFSGYLKPFSLTHRMYNINSVTNNYGKKDFKFICLFTI